MRFQLAILIVSTFGITGSFGQIPANSAELSSLFEFNSADEASWQVVNDGVMGGRSVSRRAAFETLLGSSATHLICNI